MSIGNWLKRCFSRPGKAVSLYRSGMAKANKRNFKGAIADYTAAIDEPNIPADVRAMVLYNRALAYSAVHDDAKSAEDIAAVLQMPRLAPNIKTMAQERRERLRKRSENTYIS